MATVQIIPWCSTVFDLPLAPPLVLLMSAISTFPGSVQVIIAEPLKSVKEMMAEPWSEEAGFLEL
ncbi:MAG: hypothetical protein ACR2QF_01165 [Geminicoccaceae bacterium]